MKQALKAGFGFSALAAVALVTGSDQATGEGSICAPREDLVSQLDLQYSESQKAVGVMDEQSVMEVFASDHGSWTILSTDVNGTSCIVAAGEGWDDGFAMQVGEGV